jgi:hypothetical protein
MNLVLKLISSPWFWVDAFFSIVGGIIVWYGLVLEKSSEIPERFEAFTEQEKTRRSTANKGAMLVRVGIIVEVISALGISVLSGLQMADSDLHVAVIESNNLILKTNVASLQLAVIRLAHQYDESTNALAEANARLSTIKPAKEQLIDLLKSLNTSPNIMNALKLGITNFNGSLDSLVVSKLEEFARNPETAMFLSIKRNGGAGMTADGHMEVSMILTINPKLLK